MFLFCSFVSNDHLYYQNMSEKYGKGNCLPFTLHTQPLTLKKTVSGNRKTVSNTLSMRYSYSMDIKDSQGLFRVALWMHLVDFLIFEW